MRLAENSLMHHDVAEYIKEEAGGVLCFSSGR